MRELAGERPQVAGVLIEPSQQRREAARQVAEFVAGVGFRQDARQVALAPQRRFARRPEPRDAQRHAAGEPECRHHREQRDEQREIQQARERAVAQRQPAIRGLRQLDDAEHVLAIGRVDGRRRGDDDAVFITAGEQRGFRLALRHARGEAFRGALALRLRDTARYCIAVEKQSVHARQEAAHAGVVAGQCGGVDACEYRAGR